MSIGGSYVSIRVGYSYVGRYFYNITGMRQQSHYYGKPNIYVVCIYAGHRLQILDSYCFNQNLMILKMLTLFYSSFQRFLFNQKHIKCGLTLTYLSLH